MLHAKALDDYGVPMDEDEGEEWKIVEIPTAEFIRILFVDKPKRIPAGYRIEKDGKILATAQALIEWQGKPGLLCSTML